MHREVRRQQGITRTNQVKRDLDKVFRNPAVHSAASRALDAITPVTAPVERLRAELERTGGMLSSSV